MKKLVRDKIPKISEKNGEKKNFYKANEEEFRDELFKKLLEEAKEVFDEKNNKENLKEELGDLLEIFYTILKTEKISFEEIEKIRKEKLEKRGAFEEKFILEI